MFGVLAFCRVKLSFALNQFNALVFSFSRTEAAGKLFLEAGIVAQIIDSVGIGSFHQDYFAVFLAAH